jgi:hypothetical protein
MRAFFTAPLFYIHGTPTPLWVIDSLDGRGTGKTTLVETVAQLYKTELMKASKEDLTKQMEKVNKRLLSSSGRSSRVFLLDNIVGDFECPAFADMVTAQTISGMAPYGRGEEVRPNNLTYAITSNSASLDPDLVDRAYYIYVKRAILSGSWKMNLDGFIKEYRYNILADMIDMLECNKKFDVKPATRAPEFEAIILQAYCKTEEDYHSTIKILKKRKGISNTDDEKVEYIKDTIERLLIYLNKDPKDPFFIQTSALKTIFIDAREYKINNIKNTLSDYARQGLLPIDKNVVIYPFNGKGRKRGILWNGENKENLIRIIGKSQDGRIGVII